MLQVYGSELLNIKYLDESHTSRSLEKRVEMKKNPRSKDTHETTQVRGTRRTFRLECSYAYRA